MVFLEDSRDWDTFLNFTQMDRSRLVTMKAFIEGCLVQIDSNNLSDHHEIAKVFLLPVVFNMFQEFESD